MSNVQATAGLRLLGEQQSGEILKAVRPFIFRSLVDDKWQGEPEPFRR